MFGATAHTDLDGLYAYLDGLPIRVADATNEAAEAVVGSIQANWSGYYPPTSSPGEQPAIRSGELEQSVVVDALAIPDPNGCAAHVAVTAAYAGYLEYGTSKMAARPFVRPAVFDVRAALPNLYRKALVRR